MTYMKNKSKTKIAIISAKKPALESGSEGRNYYLSNGLAKKFSVKVYLPTLRASEKKLDLLHRVKLIVSGKIPYIEILKKAQFKEKDLSQLKNIDIVQIQEMSGYYMFEKYLDGVKGKIVLDTHNIDYLRFLSETESKNIVERYLGRLLSIKLKRMELKALQKFDHILVCSQLEKDYYSKHIDSNKITVIPNGADYKTFNASKRPMDNTILFMGLLSYQPNIEGLKYYIEQIHPKVLSKIPNAQLMILGKDAPEWLKNAAINDPTIKLVGFVKDVREYLKKAKVCICPILSGSGTRLKILEYMAMGKPVVSTSIGAEGIMVKNKHNILLADNSNLFSENIVTVLLDKKLSEKLGRNARRVIKKNYMWDTIIEKLQKLYDKV